MPTASGLNPLLVFDIDGVVRDVAGSYRRALADTVEQFTGGALRPSPEQLDALKAEGLWNNDWEGSRELVLRYCEQQGTPRAQVSLDYSELVDFFQGRYWGQQVGQPQAWDGYITREPLLLERSYFEALTAAGLAWGFFSGATRGSALYVLSRRIGLAAPVLVAMEDAPGKPDPTGLLSVAQQLAPDRADSPVLYIGDTVADMQTVVKARQVKPDRAWLAVGVLPPHIVASEPSVVEDYSQGLRAAGADWVLSRAVQLTPERVAAICANA